MRTLLVAEVFAVSGACNEMPQLQARQSVAPHELPL